ncbi:MAG: hypothetical protein GXO83_01020 [Chlorobi bacterium]|nr:hypothetical protein [Chlorobiota bacterium]
MLVPSEYQSPPDRLSDRLFPIPSKVVLSLFLFFFSILSLSAEETHPDTGFTTSPSFFYQYESGVSNRISLQDISSYTFPNRLTLFLGIRLHLNENRGLGTVALSLQNIPGLFPWMTFHVDAAHLEYPDYSTGENQVVALVYVSAIRRVGIHTGMGYRSPDFADQKVHSPFDWTHETDELFPLFNLSWQFMNRNQHMLTFITGNYFFMNFRTIDHWMFGLDGAYTLSPAVQLRLQLISAVKGISGFVFSINEIQANAGIKIRF